MKRTFVVATILLAALSSTHARAEDETSTPKPPRTRRAIDVQVDPTPLFLRGYAPEIGLSVGHHRMYGTFVSYDVPTLLREDRSFDERRWIMAVGYQHFFLDHLRGPFASASLGLYWSRFERLGEARTSTTMKSTVRIGWAFSPIAAVPDFFVAPWVGPVFAYDPSDLRVGDQRVDRRIVSFSGAIQLGWRFGLPGE